MVSVVSPQLGVHPCQAALLQVGVQRLKALEGRHRHQEVAAHVAHHPLHLPLVIALARSPEPVLEPVVGLQLGKRPGPLTTTIPQYPGHRQLRIVVQNALGHAAQEGKGRDVTVQKGLGGLRRICLHKATVAVGQVQHQVVHLPLHPGDDRHRLPEITLGVTWWVGQGHEHLLGPSSVLPDVVLDRRVSAVEPVLIPQPLKDPLRRVALLPGNLVVSFQDGGNYPGEGRKLGSAGWFLASVPWGRRVGQHLAHRVPVQAKHPGGFPNTHPFHHAGPANPRVHLHCKHPSHLPKTDNQPYGRQRTVRFPAAINQPAEPPTWSTLPPPFTA